MNKKLFVYLFIFILTIYLVNIYYKEDEHIVQIKNKISPLFPAIKGMYIRSDNKTYIINKKHIYIQVYDKQGKAYDINTLVYLCLHEIAHILCDNKSVSESHSVKYRKIFSDILNKSIKLKIFIPKNSIHKDFI